MNSALNHKRDKRLRRRILDAIEARSYDTITHRARVGNVARMALLWRVWRGGEWW